MFDFLVKTASVLRSVDSKHAVQAAEAIDGVLMANAAGAMTLDELESFHGKLSAFLQDTLGGGKVPYGFKNMLRPLKAGERTLVKKLERAKRRAAKGSTPVEPSDPDLPFANPDDVVELDGDMGWAAPEDVLEIAPPPSKQAKVLADLVRVADKLDADGMVATASILDGVITSFAAGESIEDIKYKKYDYEANNKSMVRDQTLKAVERSREDHMMQSHHGKAVSHTRYAPELPGVTMRRLSDGVYQDTYTNKIYNFHSGFKLSDGTQLSGGSVSHQTPEHLHYGTPTRVFEGLSRKK